MLHGNSAILIFMLQRKGRSPASERTNQVQSMCHWEASQ